MAFDIRAMAGPVIVAPMAGGLSTPELAARGPMRADWDLWPPDI
ncbi:MULTISPECIES: hypothetical protein [unclassified Mycobacteroides]